jgi:hypothetical protein
LVRVHDKGKRPFVRIDHQVARVGVKMGVLRMRKQIAVAARQRDLYGKIDGPA